MNKALLIKISVLIVMVGVLLNLPDLIGQEMYRNIMVTIGCWQVGVWCADLGNYLVRKFDA
jgi:hypothetical protein